MTPLAKTIALIVTPAVAGAVCLDCGVMWTGGTLLCLAVVALCIAPMLVVVFEDREARTRLRQYVPGDSAGET